jgi:hypothetical protein
MLTGRTPRRQPSSGPPDQPRSKIISNVTDVTVDLTLDPPGNLSRMSEAARLPLGLT